MAVLPSLEAIIHRVPGVQHTQSLSDALRVFVEHPSAGAIPVLIGDAPIGLICRELVADVARLPCYCGWIEQVSCLQFVSHFPTPHCIEANAADLARALVSERYPRPTHSLVVTESGAYLGVIEGQALLDAVMAMGSPLSTSAVPSGNHLAPDCRDASPFGDCRTLCRDPESEPPQAGGQRSMARNVLFVAYPGMSLHDLAGPQTVFWAGSNYARDRGIAEYRCHTASITGGMVTTVEGAAIQTLTLDTFDLHTVDTIVVPGSPTILQIARAETSLIEWLKVAGQDVRRVASVCSGALLLAFAGLLDGKRATTHWTMHDKFRELFPAVQLEPSATLVQQHNLWTSAGVTTGIDLALAMVEADCGSDIAFKIAKELAVHMKSPNVHPRLGEIPMMHGCQVPMFESLHLWITHNLPNEKFTVEQLANYVGMSPRNFARVYKKKIGCTPSKGVERFRLEAALRLLQDVGRSIDAVAHECGFGNEERMRLIFRRHLGLTPSEYRLKVHR